MREKKLGKALASLRKNKDLSVYAVAKESGLSRAMIAKLESGDANPTLKTLEKLAKPLGTTLVEMVGILTGEDTAYKTNIGEVEQRISRDGSFYSYPVSSRARDRDIEIFYFEFQSKGEHRAVRKSGTSLSVFVLSGKLTLEIDEEKTMLGSKDFLQDRVNKYYTYKQETSALAKGIVVLHYGP